MAIMAIIAGAIIGFLATLAGVWLGVWLVRRLDLQNAMPVLPMGTVVGSEPEPEAPIRSPDLRQMWPQWAPKEGEADAGE